MALGAAGGGGGGWLRDAQQAASNNAPGGATGGATGAGQVGGSNRNGWWGAAQEAGQTAGDLFDSVTQQTPTPTSQLPASYPGIAGAVGTVGEQGHYNAAAQQAQNYGNVIFGPDQNAINYQEHSLNQQGILDAMQAALGRQDLHNTYGTSSARLDLQGNELGIASQQLALKNQGLGIDRRGLQNQGKYLGQMAGIHDRDLASKIDQYERDLATDQRTTTSDATSRGGYFSPFHRLDLADNYANALSGMSSAARHREGQQYAYDKDMANIGLDHERLDLGYQDIGLSEQQLDNQAAELGISRDELNNSLQQGLAQLGLDQQISGQQLADALFGNQNAAEQLGLDQQAAQQLFLDIILQGGNPALIPLLGNVTSNLSP